MQTASADPEDVKATSEYKALISKIESTPQDAISIFGLFAFRGHKISAEESAEAMRREERMVEGESEYQDLGGHSPKLPDTEIYPHGEEVVVALSEDMYPGATAYFSKHICHSLAAGFPDLRQRRPRNEMHKSRMRSQ